MCFQSLCSSSVVVFTIIDKPFTKQHPGSSHDFLPTHQPHPQNCPNCVNVLVTTALGFGRVGFGQRNQNIKSCCQPSSALDELCKQHSVFSPVVSLHFTRKVSSKHDLHVPPLHERHFMLTFESYCNNSIILLWDCSICRHVETLVIKKCFLILVYLVYIIVGGIVIPSSFYARPVPIYVL